MTEENKVAATEVPADVKIRHCLPSDALAIQKICSSSFCDADLRQHGSGIYIASFADVYVAELSIDGKSAVVGYLAPCEWDIGGDYGVVDIVNWIAVDPAYRRKGVAEAMIRQAIKDTPESLYLVVRKSNKNAQALYTKIGFVHLETFKDFYSAMSTDKDDALLLCHPK
jgi:ribosomal protein S18 acetylase RimI-like enzyme